jgi:hypothetical protein
MSAQTVSREIAMTSAMTGGFHGSLLDYDPRSADLHYSAVSRSSGGRGGFDPHVVQPFVPMPGQSPSSRGPSSSSSSSSSLNPTVIDLEFEPFDYDHPDDCYLPPKCQMNIIDDDLSKLGLARYPSSYDGNCFFTSVSVCLTNIDKKYASYKASDLRALTANLLCRDIFTVNIDTLKKTALKDMRINLRSFSFALLALTDNVLAPSLLMNARDSNPVFKAADIKKTIDLIIEYATDGHFSDARLASLLVASVFNRPVRTFSLMRIPPALIPLTHYPFGDKDKTGIYPEFINIVFHSHHFEPALPCKYVHNTLAANISSSSSSTVPAPAAVSVDGSKSMSVDSSSSSTVVSQLPSMAMHAGATKPYVLYAYDRDKLCFDMGDMTVPIPQTPSDNYMLNMRISRFVGKYISPTYIYAITLNPGSASDIWYLFSVKRRSKDTPSTCIDSLQLSKSDYACNLLSVAVATCKQCCFLLDQDVICLIAVNVASRTIAELNVLDFSNKSLS